MIKIKLHTVFVLLTVLAIGSSCEDSNESKPITPQDIEQPKADNTEIELGRLIGFWDFNSNGTNAVTEQCGDWALEGVEYNEGILTSKPLEGNISMKNANPVVVDAYEWSEARGINRYKYFSGAIRFKVSAKGENTLLTFGLSHRFLHFALRDDKVSITLPNANGESDKSYISKSAIQPDTWHVLYYRVEEFNPAATSAGSDNNIYIQIDNQATEAFNYGEVYFDKLYDLMLPNFDRVMCFGDLSRGMRFEGECDWVMLCNGRMTPGNTQWYLKDLVK